MAYVTLCPLIWCVSCVECSASSMCWVTFKAGHQIGESKWFHSHATWCVTGINQCVGHWLTGAVRKCIIMVLQNTNISLSRKETADTQMCLWDNNNSEALWQVINKHYWPKFDTWCPFLFKLPLTISWSKSLLEDSYNKNQRDALFLKFILV